MAYDVTEIVIKDNTVIETVIKDNTVIETEFSPEFQQLLDWLADFRTYQYDFYISGKYLSVSFKNIYNEFSYNVVLDTHEKITNSSINIDNLNHKDKNFLSMSSVIFERNNIPDELFEAIKFELITFDKELYSSFITAYITNINFIDGDKAEVEFDDIVSINYGFDKFVIDSNVWKGEWLRMNHNKNEENVLMQYIDNGPIFDLRPIINMSIDIRRVSAAFSINVDVILILDGEKTTIPMSNMNASKKLLDFINAAKQKHMDDIADKYDSNEYIADKLNRIESHYLNSISKLENEVNTIRDKYENRLVDVSNTLENIENMFTEQMNQMDSNFDKAFKEFVSSSEASMTMTLENIEDKVSTLNSTVRSLQMSLDEAPTDLFEE